jgi:hypothetical protein
MSKIGPKLPFADGGSSSITALSAVGDVIADMGGVLGGNSPSMTLGVEKGDGDSKHKPDGDSAKLPPRKASTMRLDGK